jgi:hypothetical protein
LLAKESETHIKAADAARCCCRFAAHLMLDTRTADGVAAATSPLIIDQAPVFAPMCVCGRRGEEEGRRFFGAPTLHPTSPQHTLNQTHFYIECSTIIFV